MRNLRKLLIGGSALLHRSVSYQLFPLRNSLSVRSFSTADPLSRSSAVVQLTDVQQAIANAELSGTSPTRRPRCVSGIQPTGSLHLGNYLGAVQQWKALQKDFDSYFFVVDMHAITIPAAPGAPAKQAAKRLRAETLQAVAMYLASGLDPNKCKIYVQSHVRAHVELSWLLTCHTPLSWLDRMTQFKDKSAKMNGEASVAAGLLMYPVLMASDILLFQPDYIPVGSDQVQHVELTRDLARRMNDQFRTSLFRLPQAMVSDGARVMSLTDASSKMSKSAENDRSRINLFDTPEVIVNKIKRCKTDALPYISFGDLNNTQEWEDLQAAAATVGATDALPSLELRTRLQTNRPEAANLLSIYKAVSGKSNEEVLSDVAGLNWGQFKPLLSEAVVSHLQPIQKRYNELMADPEYLDSVLRQGQASADEVAEATLRRVKETMGFLQL